MNNIELICTDNDNLVRKIAAKHFKKYRNDGLIEFEDFLAMGFIGLLDAAKRFDSKRKVSFKAFASHRVRGEILDGTKKFLQIGRGITTVNVDQLTLEKISIQNEKIRSEIYKKEIINIIENIINRHLNNKEKNVINLKYRSGLTTTAIAKIMDLSRGRISQLESKAIDKIKKKMVDI